MARKLIFKSSIKKAANISLRSWEAALREVRPEIEAEIRDSLGKQTGPFGPPAPKGRPPRRRSGNLQDTFRIRVRKGTRGRAAAYEFTGNEYSRAQEFGRPEINMGPHPYVRPVLMSRGSGKLKKKWQDKIARVARQKTKTKSTRR